MPLTHNSTLADSEPPWASVNKSELPPIAFAVVEDPKLKSTWHAPHHWIRDDTMYLHRGGLIAAKAAIAGARTGKIPPWRGKAIPHLNKHLEAIGLTKAEMAWTPETATAILTAIENEGLDDNRAIDIIAYHVNKQPDVLNPALMTDEELASKWTEFAEGWERTVEARGVDCRCSNVLYQSAFDIFEEGWLRGLDATGGDDGPLAALITNTAGYDIPAVDYIRTREVSWGPAFAAEMGGTVTKLNSMLNKAIDSKADENTTRADITGKMAEAAGIDMGTVDKILSGGIRCPPLERLSGFGKVLGISADSLKNAAISDGCSYDASEA